MIVVVSGSRTLQDSAWVEAALNAELTRCFIANPPSLSFRVGDARGVDALAAAFCTANAVNFRVYRAAWDSEGKAAGSLRNWEMMKGPPRADLLVALWQDWSPGTRNAIACAMNQQIECRVRVYPDAERVYDGPEAVRKANIAWQTTQSSLAAPQDS